MHFMQLNFCLQDNVRAFNSNRISKFEVIKLSCTCRITLLCNNALFFKACILWKKNNLCRLYNAVVIAMHLSISRTKLWIPRNIISSKARDNKVFCGISVVCPRWFQTEVLKHSIWYSYNTAYKQLTCNQAFKVIIWIQAPYSLSLKPSI